MCRILTLGKPYLQFGGGSNVISASSLWILQKEMSCNFTIIGNKLGIRLDLVLSRLQKMPILEVNESKTFLAHNREIGVTFLARRQY